MAFAFEIAQLANSLKNELPEVVFAYLMGSTAAEIKAGHAKVNPHSDLDIAVYIDLKNRDKNGSFSDNFEIYSKAQQVVEDVVGSIRCDLGILNNADPVYRYEALKGYLLYSRDEERRSGFFSLTCREYESQMFHYEKQHHYRLEAMSDQIRQVIKP